MNSDASDARKDRGGRGERRYLRLGRESGVQIPGDESWLDDLDEYEVEGGELDDEEVRRLVGTVLDSGDEQEGCWDGDQDLTVLDLEGTPRAAGALGGERGVKEEDAMAGAERSESSLWDESDAFWSSSTPPPEVGKPTEVAKPSAGAKSKKRQFEVAKDEPGTPQESPVLGHARSGKKHRDSYEVKSDRKRSVLGDGTPNVGVRIQVTSSTMTPGSYYDEQGFLR